MIEEQVTEVKTELIVNIFDWLDLAAYPAVLAGCLFAYMIFVLILRAVGGDD